MKTTRPILVLVFSISCLIAFTSLSMRSDKTMKFQIKKDQHTSNNRCIRFPKNGQITFNFHVNPTWLYDEKAPGFQTGWNKLIGISEGFSQHKHSVRIGWRCIENTIYMCSYCYIDGERKISDMVEVPMGWNSGSVRITDNSYIVVINNQIIAFEKSNSSLFKIMMYPYFGGNSTAPHNIQFEFRMNPW
jgi:hypothetical protein